MKEPRSRPGLDHYWDAIPFDEIVDLARARAKDCGAGTAQEIRACAEHAVRSSLCPCASAEKSIVRAVVEEFERLARPDGEDVNRAGSVGDESGPGSSVSTSQDQEERTTMKVPQLDVPGDVGQLVSYQGGSVVSQTLIKSKAGTVTVFAFDAGEGLSEHIAPFDALVLGLEGQATVSVNGKPHALRAGQVLRLPATVPHAIQADEPFKMMLVMIKDSGT